MTVKELRKALNDYPDDMEVLTKKTELLGNVAYINSVKEESYGFFGADVPCVLLTDEFEPQESDHKCHTCKHYTSGKNDGSCGSYICKGYSNWESEDKGMTLDEAIIHAEEVAEKNEGLCEQIHPAAQWKDYGKCASEHRQLAKWLRDYKRLKEREPCDDAVSITQRIPEPKQVELEGDGYAYGTDEIVYDLGKCPNCGWMFEEGDKDWEEPYCCHCGQRLKWFKESEE